MDEQITGAHTGSGCEETTPLVSVIIPVYNVEAYLPACLESVTGQTLRDTEILLIDDGSEDRSYAVCLEWQARDSRIRCFHQENSGVSSARNRGLKEARGRCIAFVDSDDWLDPAYLEKLYAALCESGAAFAECDLWRCDNRSGKKIYRSCYGRMGIPYTLTEHMKYGPTATYKSMSLRSLWEEHDLRLPDCAFESPAVYALVVALSGEVASVREPLYYYRRFRENSLIETGYAARDGSANNTLGIEAMQFLLDSFRARGLWEQYGRVLPGVVIYRLNDILAMQFHRKSEADFRAVVSNFRYFLARAFPERENPVYLTVGGYNLNRILTHMNVLHDPGCRFNFSSLVSLAGPRPDLPAMRHPNRYREMMLERENRQIFWETLRDKKPEYLFLDLMEERFDLLRAGDAYITESDAWLGGAYPGDAAVPTLERIPRRGEDCRALWEDSARRFFSRLREAVPGIRICVVESLLCEEVGSPEARCSHPGLEVIRETNGVLRRYYRFLHQLLPEARFFPVADDPLYFTDRNYEYGAVPSHVNELENQKIAERIEKTLFRKRREVRFPGEKAITDGKG